MTFSDKDIALINRAIDVPAIPYRLALLPKVLRSWAEIDLVEYASVEASRMSAKITSNNCKKVAHFATELGKAFDAMAESNDQVVIAAEMRRGNQSLTAQRQRVHYNNEFDEQRSFLSELTIAALSLERKLKMGPGQPRNTASYLVVRDIARVFEWLTDVPASRRTDPINGEATGPFFRFASSIWPPVFASADDGLSAAMKNWAIGRKFDSSALMANIDLRQPLWRVLAR